MSNEMTPDERRGMRFALLILALASGAGAAVSWLALDGYDQAVALTACGTTWLLANVAQLALAPRTKKRPGEPGALDLER